MDSFNNQVIHISTYPRKGTETELKVTLSNIRRISTYPRKGTETSAISLDGEWMPISTYPRKGTETNSAEKNQKKNRFQLIPARGR